MKEDLFEKISSNEFCYFGHLELEKLEFTNKNLLLTVKLSFDNQDNQDNQDSFETWQITCSNIISYNIDSTSMESLFLTKNSPSLFYYQKPLLKINFKGKVCSPAKVFLEFYQTHRNIFSKSVLFEKFFYYKFLDMLLNEPTGEEKMFAAGPEDLIKAYGKILEHDGVKVFYETLEQALKDKYPAYLEKRNSLAKNIQILSWGQHSYIIANLFDFRKLE